MLYYHPNIFSAPPLAFAWNLRDSLESQGITGLPRLGKVSVFPRSHCHLSFITKESNTIPRLEMVTTLLIKTATDIVCCCYHASTDGLQCPSSMEEAVMNCLKCSSLWNFIRRAVKSNRRPSVWQFIDLLINWIS